MAAGHEAPAGPTPFALLGGETPVRALVDRFYDLMDLEPQFAALRALLPPYAGAAPAVICEAVEQDETRASALEARWQGALVVMEGKDAD